MADLLDVGISHDNATYVSSGRYFIADAKMAGSKKQVYDVVEQTSLNSLSNIFATDGATTDIELIPSSGGIDIIQDQILRMRMTPTISANAHTLNPSAFIISRYELWIGDSRVYEATSETIWYDMLLMSTEEELSQRAVAEGFDPTTLQGNTALTSGTQVELFLRLDNLLNRAGVLISVLRQRIMWRIFWRTHTAATSTNNVGFDSMSLDSLTLFIGGVKFNANVKNMVFQKFFNQQVVYRYYEPRTINFSVSLTQNSDVNVSITQFNHKAPYFLFVVRADNPANNNLLNNLVDVNSFALRDEMGKPVGLSTYDGDLVLRYLLPSAFPELSQSRNTAGLEFYGIVWADDAPLSIKEGVASGHERFRTNFVLTVNSTVTANQNLLLICPAEMNLIVQRGVVASTQTAGL